ncbi:MAG: hypothetical protein R3F37_22745 [Candidatus Competibacteraceae bacterium]
MTAEVERYLLRHYGQPLDRQLRSLGNFGPGFVSASHKLTVPIYPSYPEGRAGRSG